MIPSSIKDLTVEQWQKVDAIVNSDKSKLDKQIDLLELFGQSIDKYPANKLYNVEHFFNPIVDMPIVNSFTINGIKFKPCDSLQEMKVNQMVDYSEILKVNENNIAKCIDMLLPIVFVTEKGYEPDKHKEYKELFKKAKLGDVLGAVFFYTKYWQRVERITQNYLMKNVKLIQERMNEISQMEIHS